MRFCVHFIFHKFNQMTKPRAWWIRVIFFRTPERTWNRTRRLHYRSRKLTTRIRFCNTLLFEVAYKKKNSIRQVLYNALTNTDLFSTPGPVYWYNEISIYFSFMRLTTLMCYTTMCDSKGLFAVDFNPLIIESMFLPVSLKINNSTP